jgi:hypothetical protein
MDKIIKSVKIEITPKDQELPIDWDMDARLVLTLDDGSEEILYYSSEEVTFQEDELLGHNFSDAFYLLGYKECKHTALKHLQQILEDFNKKFTF